MGWFKSWAKKALAIALPIVVGVAITALTGGLGAPVLVALAAGGFAAGVTHSVLGAKLRGEKPRLKDALVTGAFNAAFAVATLGVGRFLAPIVGRALPVTRQLLAQPIANSTAGAILSTSARAAANSVNGRPLTEGTGGAALQGAATALVVAPLVNAAMKAIPLPKALPPPATAAPAPKPVSVWTTWPVRGPAKTVELTVPQETARRIANDLLVRTPTPCEIEVVPGALSARNGPPVTLRVTFAADDAVGPAVLAAKLPGAPAKTGGLVGSLGD